MLGSRQIPSEASWPNLLTVPASGLPEAQAAIAGPILYLFVILFKVRCLHTVEVNVGRTSHHI